MKTRNILLTTIFVLGISLSTFAQRGTPTFAQYPARVEKLRNIQVDLKSNKYARNYRTNLRNAAKDGVNFAGHFVVANWGCGTNCSETAIIDGRNGKVFFPETLQGATFGFCDLGDADEPIEYKKNSRLFILKGFKSGDLDKKNSKCGYYYFEWTGTALRQVKLIEKKRSEMP
jgi:hypothetical protein